MFKQDNKMENTLVSFQAIVIITNYNIEIYILKIIYLPMFNNEIFLRIKHLITLCYFRESQPLI